MYMLRSDLIVNVQQIPNELLMSYRSNQHDGTHTPPRGESSDPDNTKNDFGFSYFPQSL